MAGFISPSQVEDRFAVSLATNVVGERRLQGFTAGSGARIQRTRNSIVRDFLETGPEFEWFWMLDADMVLPHDALTTLLKTAEEKQRKLVGGLGYIFRPNENPPYLASIVHKYKERDDGLYPFDEATGERVLPGATYIINEPPTERYIEADATGFFCLLIHRSVLEAMGERFAHLHNPWIDEMEQGAENSPKGPDMEFFDRALEATGETPLIDTSVQCGHIKKVNITHEVVVHAWRSRALG